MRNDDLDIEKQYRREWEGRDSGMEILEKMSYEEAKEHIVPLMQERIEKNHSLELLYRRIKRIAKNFYAPNTFEYNFSIDAVWLLRGLSEDIENQTRTYIAP